MEDLPRFLFDIYALSLPRGHGFGDRPPIKGWRSADGAAFGVARKGDDGAYGALVMRRRVDGLWVLTADEYGLDSLEAARARIADLLREGSPAEPLPPNTAPRPSLGELGPRTPGQTFDLLRQRSHHRAAWVLNQLYLALPRPDKNWASDCQTANFHTRLWEALLLACFREQGVLLTQPFESPDFKLEDRHGHVGWVEAVTANPATPYEHVNAKRVPPPMDKQDLFFGPAAERFAKTLRSKLDRRYHERPHVAGQPLVFALADFHAPASMTWSREGLIGYLYGLGAEVAVVDGARVGRYMAAPDFVGQGETPIGLFTDGRHAELSAVIFSNACSMAKLNRVVASAGGAPEGLRWTRVGEMEDRRPGALAGIPFAMDVTSEAYRALWPGGYEPWSAELEVFHNPYAQYPFPFSLAPEANHWFEQDGEMICQPFYETSILWSQTYIQSTSAPPLSLERLLNPDGVSGEAID